MFSRRFSKRALGAARSSSLTVGVIFGALFVALSVVYFTQDLRGYQAAENRAHADGVYYFAYLRSLAFDGDLDFANDYRLLGNPLRARYTKTGRLGNVSTIGPALFWAPSLAATHATLAVTRLLEWHDDPLDGASTFYQRGVFFGSVCWGFVAILLVWWLARRYVDPFTACLAAIGMALATPLTWYMLRQPSYSHAVDAGAVALFVFYWHRTLFQRRLGQWILLGALGGCMMLVRPQNIGHCALPLIEFIILWRRSRAPGNAAPFSPHLIGAVVCGLAAIVAYLPQMLAWRTLYGSFLVIPHDEQFTQYMYWNHSKWLETLFSSRAGLFAWHPLTLLSVIGLIAAAIVPALGSQRRVPRIVSLGFLLAFALQVYINSCAEGWWGGWSFGGRRFSSCIIYLGFGLAMTVQGSIALLRRGQRAVILAVPAFALGLFCFVNASFMRDYLDQTMRANVPQPMEPHWQRAMKRLVHLGYDYTGNPGSLPANLFFSWRTGAPPATFDEVIGVELGGRRPSKNAKVEGNGVAVKGFSEPTTYLGRDCRWAKSSSALLAIGMRKPAPLWGHVSLAPAWPDTRVRLRLNDFVIFDTVLRPDWNVYSFVIPADHLRRGPNYVEVEQQLPRRPLWPIGKTGMAIETEVTVESLGVYRKGRASFIFDNQRVTTLERGVVVYRLDGREPREVGTYRIAHSPTEVPRLVRAIALLPAGTPVALAVSRNVLDGWTPEADAALRSLGSQQSLVDMALCSYVLIGVKDAAKNSSVETLRCDGQATVTVGRPLADRLWGVAWNGLYVSSRWPNANTTP